MSSLPHESFIFAAIDFNILQLTRSFLVLSNFTQLRSIPFMFIARQEFRLKIEPFGKEIVKCFSLTCLHTHIQRLHSHIPI